MKNFLIKFTLISTLFIFSCAPIKIRPVFLNPPPTAVYHKKAIGEISISAPEGHSYWLTAEYQTWLNKKQEFDGGVITHYYNYYGSRDTISSGNIFGFVRKWVTLIDRKNPLFNVYGGVQVSYNEYGEIINNKNFLFCSHLETGIVFGLYREKINLSLPLRLGYGVTYPKGYYLFMGPGLQCNLFIIKNLGLNFEVNYSLGVGSTEEDVAVLAVPQFLRLSIVYRWD